MRVLVVEDERRVSSLVRGVLAELGWAVDECVTGEEALDLVRAESYDAIVLDILLPGRNGLSVLNELRRQGRSTPVLVLSALDQVEDRVRGLDAGADDYLAKPFAFAELVARLRALLRRGSTLQTTVISVGDLRVDLAALKVERGGVRVDLTHKEFALLAYLARHAGQIVTRTMIAEHLWGVNFDSFTKVIEVHIRRLRSKIDDPFGSALIHTRRGLGYVLKAGS